MIAYDLRCRQGHQFEAWFKDIGTFERQRGQGFIECPHCGSARIEMVFRPRAIRRKKPAPSPAGSGPPAERIEKFLLTHFEDVGDRFAEEARKVHYGEASPRNIRGQTTAEEEMELREEGVSFLKVRIPKPAH